MTPHNINPVQWTQTLGYSRQACARIFRDGGTAGEALSAFGLHADEITDNDWSRAVDMIASALCQRPQGHAGMSLAA